MKSLLVTLSFLGFCAGISLAAPVPIGLQPRFTVQLFIQVSNIPKEMVEDYMTKALRKLTDVQVTTDGTADWIFYINVTPIMDQTGLKGYAMSTVIADRYPTKTLKRLPPEDFKMPEAAEAVKKLTNDLVLVDEQLLVTTTVDGMAKICGKIVDHFDEDYLMPTREDIDNYNRSKPTDLRDGGKRDL